MKPKIIRNGWSLFANRFPRLSCEIDFCRRNKYFERDLWMIPQYCDVSLGTIDVGANAGIFSRWMAKHSRQVDSFECNPMLLSKLKAFLPRNVRLHECALSKDEGAAVLRYDPSNTGIGTIETRNKLDQNPGIQRVLEVDVPIRRLDRFDLERVSFIKIDVEGHELEVLQGAAELLRRDKPTLLIEIEERHCEGNLERVPQWLESFGYIPKCLNTANMELTSVNCIRDEARNGTNNFWFVSESAPSRGT